MNVCVISAKEITYSETFIWSHIDNFKAKRYFVENLPVYLDVYVSPPPKSNRKQYIRFKIVNAYRTFLNKSKEKKFTTFLKNNKIDVVLAEFGPNGAKAMSACKRVNMPLVVHFHGFDASNKTTLKQYGALYLKMFGVASKIIAVSKQMRNKLIELGCPENKITIITYGVRFSENAALPNYKSKNVLAVGRFTEKKAPYLTLLSFIKVLEIIPDAKLTFVGGGELQPVVVDMVNSLFLQNSVFFKGALAHAEVLTCMQNSAVFVQHSKVASNGDCEGTPVGILEAMFLGLPVVSTYHAGIPDIIVNEETGFLVEEGDINEMAKYIIKLLQHPELGSEIGSRTRLFARENFTEDISIEKLRVVLKSASII